MTPTVSLRKRQRPNLKSGVYTLRKAVQVLGSRALPTRRTALGRELREWRAALVSDLGGEDAITTQQAALVEMAVTTRLLVGSVDGYLLGLPALVDKRHRRLWPVVRERQALVGQLQSILRDLGPCGAKSISPLSSRPCTAQEARSRARTGRSRHRARRTAETPRQRATRATSARPRRTPHGPAFVQATCLMLALLAQQARERCVWLVAGGVC